MKRNQNGFGIIEVILVVIIILALGLLAWIFIKSINNGSKTASVVQSTNPSIREEVVDKDSYVEYKDPNGKFSFMYPKSWLNISNENEDMEAGVILKLATPAQTALYTEFMKEAKGTEGPSDSTIKINRWNDINNIYAKGTEYVNQKKYNSLEDYLNDPHEGRSKQKIDEISLGKQKCFEVVIGGFSANYGIMCDTSDGLYQFNFPTILDRSSLNADIKNLIKSINFNS